MIPFDFTIDSNFVSLTGNGFFMASYTSNILPWVSNDMTTQTVVVQGCSINYGINQIG